jgi:NAD(P)-dependent dehydrogenase (short-subunit alcohol dehydrogenase family)
MDFTGKRVLVTGGTRGIGRATVEGFLERGARVAVNGSTAESANHAVAALDAGDNAFAVPGNIATVAGCRATVAAAIEGLGGLDVLVNNAGAAEGRALADCDEDQWDRIVDTNLKGTFFCIQAAAPALKEARGCIVNIGSILGVRGSGHFSSIYCASKGGVVNLTRDLAIELGPEIRVNCLCPGAIDTEMLQGLGARLGDGDIEKGYEVLSEKAPLRRVARPQEMANAVLYLASDLASFVTGSIHLADAGMSAGT